MSLAGPKVPVEAEAEGEGAGSLSERLSAVHDGENDDGDVPDSVNDDIRGPRDGRLSSVRMPARLADIRVL